MEVSAKEVSEQFDALIAGRRSPEEIERWALARMRAHGVGDLVFEPRTDEGRLWRAIVYLLGVGLKVESGEYLHSKEDFEVFREEIKV